jgi:hypothetical protein
MRKSENEDMSAEQRAAMLQYALELLKKPVSGAPLSRYVKWFSQHAKCPASRVERHPQFWDSKALAAFAGMYNLQNSMREMSANIQQKLVSSSGLTNEMNDLDGLFDMGDSSSGSGDSGSGSDDDMPEPDAM